MFEAVLRGRAVAARAQLDGVWRQELDARLAYLESDPWLDGRRTFEFPVPPLILWLCADGVWRIVYRVVDNAFIEVYDIRRTL
jgi:hypothetical protein